MATAQSFGSSRGMREWKWSPAEKAIARRVFEQALERELDGLLRETKERVTRMTSPAELWDLEEWLGERRRQIDRDYDYRYSVLVLVFTVLLQTGRISEAELAGLAGDKLEAIRFRFIIRER